MNILIRIIEAAAESTQCITQNPGDWYDNQRRAADVWQAALKAFDEFEFGNANWPCTRDHIVARLEHYRNVGD